MEVEHASPGYLVDGYYYLDGDMDESHYIELHLMTGNVEFVVEEEENSDDENEEGVFQLEKGRITGRG
jgi:hypothetical protein